MHHRPSNSYGVGMLTEYVHGGCNVTCIVTGEQWKQNAYIVADQSSFNTIIVDPGDNADLIINYIQDRGGTVTRILLTHSHHDHVGAANEVSEYFDVECELHKQDVRLLMHAPMYALRFANKKIPSVANFKHFEELKTDSEKPNIKSIHTPGHTKGSVCYLFNSFVLTGDTLLYKHIGRTDFPGSNENDLLGSVSKLLNQLSDEVIIFSGHGKPWTIGEAKSWWRDKETTPSTHDNFDQL